jgi:hypothetical protein
MKLLVNRDKTMGTHYSRGLCETTDIHNLRREFPEVKAFFDTIYTTDMRRMHLFLKDNRKRFRARFGPPVFHFKGEFDLHCWPIVVQEKKHVVRLLVMTGAGKGSCYEAFPRQRFWSASLLVKFLDHLSRMRSKKRVGDFKE